MEFEARTNAPRRNPVLRWLSVVLRTAHVVAVIGLGAAVLGAPLSGHQQALGVFGSGLATMALDLWVRPRLFREWSGVALVVKLVAVAWMAFDSTRLVPLFWGVVVWSVLFAHAPASFRHGTWQRVVR
jgi:hypothetical protein